MLSTSTNYTINTLDQSTKVELVEKLLEEKKITFREAIKLLDVPTQVKDLTPQPYISPTPYTPWSPYWATTTWGITSGLSQSTLTATNE